MAKMMKMVGSGKMPAVARDGGGQRLPVAGSEAQPERDSQGEQQAEEEESEKVTGWQ